MNTFSIRFFACTLLTAAMLQADAQEPESRGSILQQYTNNQVPGLQYATPSTGKGRASSKGFQGSSLRHEIETGGNGSVPVKTGSGTAGHTAKPSTPAKGKALASDQAAARAESGQTEKSAAVEPGAPRLENPRQGDVEELVSVPASTSTPAGNGLPKKAPGAQATGKPAATKPTLQKSAPAKGAATKSAALKP